MKYEITCPYCNSEQIYKPRKDKLPKNPHTKCKRCSREFNFNIEVSEPISKIPKKSKNNHASKGSLAGSSIPTGYTLSPELLERLIVKALNEDQSPPMIRTAVDFYSKIKMNEGVAVEDLDLTKFLKVLPDTNVETSSD